MKRAANTPARNRPRKKAAAPQPAAGAPEPAGSRNVDPLEGSFSVVAGVLLLVLALFPRSLKQLVLLSLGGGLLYRGMTGHCAVYQAVGIDTAKEPLWQQLNDKFLTPESDRAEA